MAKAQELIYAVVGAGDFAVDKVKGVRKVADRRSNQKLYKDFVKRGRSLSTKVKNSTAGKQVVARTEPAREQLEDAFKSVTKAFGVNVVAWPKGSTRGKTTARKSNGARKTTKSTARKTTAKAS